jgi:multidrug efflux system membrane fusion protein
MNVLSSSVWMVAAMTVATTVPAVHAAADARPLASVAASAGGQAPSSSYDGVVEAIRQTVIAAQVPGAVVALQARPGEHVKAGQVLLRLDARAAEQQAGAAAAQATSARATQDEATKEFERQKQLHQKAYISQAALDRAEAQYKTAQAQAAAQLAAAGAARAESSFYVVKAPYDGIVASVSVVQGDMAMPGKPLLTVYDPSALRVTAAVPLSAAPRRTDTAPQAELPGVAEQRIQPIRWQMLPAVDPGTHTVELRLDLPPGTQAAPGMFARAWLPAAAGAARVSVPLKSIVRRAELTAVYVIGAEGRPLLRQVRLGPASADQVEVLAGLAAGERVALDPQAAAKVR